MSRGKRTLKPPNGVEPKACPFPPKLLDAPVDITQIPRGFEPLPPTRFFKLGFWGMILLVVAYSLAMILPFVASLQLPYSFECFIYYWGLDSLEPLFDFVVYLLPSWLVGVGFMFSGFTFYGYWRQTGSKLALTVSVSFVASALITSIEMQLMHNELTRQILNQPPGILGNLITLVSLVSLIIALSLWVVGVFHLPREPKHRWTPIAISLFCLWAILGVLPLLPAYVIWLISPGDLPFYPTLFHLIIHPQHPWVGSGWSWWMDYELIVMKLLPAVIPSAMIFYELSPASIKAKTRNGSP